MRKKAPTRRPDLRCVSADPAKSNMPLRQCTLPVWSITVQSALTMGTKNVSGDTSNAELIGLLRDIDGFGALEPDILDQMARTAEYRDLTRGEVLIEEGDAADTLFIVLRGRFLSSSAWLKARKTGKALSMSQPT